MRHSFDAITAQAMPCYYLPRARPTASRPIRVSGIPDFAIRQGRHDAFHYCIPAASYYRKPRPTIPVRIAWIIVTIRAREPGIRCIIQITETPGAPHARRTRQPSRHEALMMLLFRKVVIPFGGACCPSGHPSLTRRPPIHPAFYPIQKAEADQSSA